jgi:hypothetical protein
LIKLRVRSERDRCADILFDTATATAYKEVLTHVFRHTIAASRRQTMFRIYKFSCVVFFMLGCLGMTPAAAEVIQLDNGDVIHGELIQINLKTVKLRHEIMGELEIPRERVRAIVMGHPTKGVRIKPDGTEAEQETPKEIIDRLVNKEFGPDTVKQLEVGAERQTTPADAVKQLRREGVDPQLRESLQMMLPGFGTPEVQGYFNSRVAGLKDGSITIQNIRDDAIDARDQLREVMDDLGVDGAALQGYYSILDNFIERTAPPKPAAKPVDR